MADDSAAPSMSPQTTLAGYCLWHELGEPYCYAQAELVIIRPSGETLGFSCSAHRDGWAPHIRGEFLVLKRAEWEARGAGYRGPMLGG